MSTKELAYSMIDNLTEEQLNALIVILQGLQKEEPNEETKKVLDEAKEGKNLVGPFDSVDELWESLNASDNLSQQIQKRLQKSKKPWPKYVAP